MILLCPQRRLLLGGTAAAAAALAVVYHDDPKQLQFDAASAAGPLLRLADAETSHNLGLRAAAWGLFPRETRADPPQLGVTLWGRRFRNPLGDRPAHLAIARSRLMLLLICQQTVSSLRAECRILRPCALTVWIDMGAACSQWLCTPSGAVLPE